ENVLKSLDDRAFDKPISEVLLNQQYFNTAVFHSRSQPCVLRSCRAWTVLEALKDQDQERRKKDPSLMLSKKAKLRQENSDVLELSHTLPMEVITAEKQLFDPEHLDNYATFKNCLQCYLVPGTSSLHDHRGRTTWLQGKPGPVAPKGEAPAM
ncbi:hypothetical protein HGM15179_015869, partial [Zosterops borbonicus]